MAMHFYNAKINGTWQEVYTNGERGNKPEALKIFQKFDKDLKLKDVYSVCNTPPGCPYTFTKWLNE